MLDYTSSTIKAIYFPDPGPWWIIEHSVGKSTPGRPSNPNILSPSRGQRPWFHLLHPPVTGGPRWWWLTAMAARPSVSLLTPLYLVSSVCVHTCEPVCSCACVCTCCVRTVGQRGESRAIHEDRARVCLSRFQFASAWWPRLAEASALGLSVRKNMTLGSRFHRLCRFCGEQPRGDSLEHTRYWWGDALPSCFVLPRNLPSLFLQIFFQKTKTDNQKLF